MAAVTGQLLSGRLRHSTPGRYAANGRINADGVGKLCEDLEVNPPSATARTERRDGRPETEG